MKKTLVAVAAVAALGMATIPAAQAHDRAGPIIAGAVLGAVIGTVIANSHPVPAPVAVYPAPPPPPRVIYAPPPRVVYAEPVVVYGPRHRHYRHYEWRGHDRRHHDRRYH